MPVHDWTRVEAGIFHHFHHSWITEIARNLNRNVLPRDYYALAEQHAAGFGPDVLTLQEVHNGSDYEPNLPGGDSSGGGLELAEPKLKPTAETDLTFYRRKQNSIAVRHVSGDDLIAMIEIVSPGNKDNRSHVRAFVEKAGTLVNEQIHLLIIDLFPPGRRDPQGMHGLIWEDIAGQEYTAPSDKPLALIAYESSLSVRAYVVHLAVGDRLTEMPLFLDFRKSVEVPLEATYQAAFAELPRRWRRVLDMDHPEG